MLCRINCALRRPGLLLSGGSAGAAAPPWYQPIVDLLAAGGGGYLWLHEQGISEGLEQPVSAWADVTGTRSFVQPGVSSIRPIRKAGALRFDGIDDRMNEDTELPTWLARTSGPWTVGVGSPTVTPLNSDLWWGACLTGMATNVVQLASNNQLARVGGPATLATADPRPGPVSAWVAVTDSTLALRRISGAQTTGAYGTQLAGIDTFTLGAIRSGSPRNFLLGDISWVIIAPFALSSTDMASVEALMVANGYPT